MVVLLMTRIDAADPELRYCAPSPPSTGTIAPTSKRTASEQSHAIASGFRCDLPDYRTRQSFAGLLQISDAPLREAITYIGQPGAELT
jgi:hypothetical protein